MLLYLHFTYLTTWHVYVRSGNARRNVLLLNLHFTYKTTWHVYVRSGNARINMLLYLHFTNLTTWHVYLSKVWKRKEKYVVISTLYIYLTTWHVYLRSGNARRNMLLYLHFTNLTTWHVYLSKVWKREKKYVVISTFYII